MLLNEFLKAHRKIEDQENAIAELKAKVAGLTARVNSKPDYVRPASASGMRRLDAQQIVNRQD